MLVTVIGAGNPTPGVEALAEQVGAELGKRGVGVVCGGLEGVMAAACRGAKSTGGLTIGIIPGRDPAEANGWVDIPICTGMGFVRNVIVVRAGRAVIAVGGAFGTLSEIGFALAEGIPVVGLSTWAFSRNGVVDQSMIPAQDPVDAVDKAIEAAKKRDGVASASSHGSL